MTLLQQTGTLYQHQARQIVQTATGRRGIEIGLAATRQDDTYKVQLTTAVKKIDRIDQKLHAISADRHMLKLFRQSGEQLVLIKMDSIYYDENGSPMEYKIAYYRADVYSFELKRELE